MQLVSMHVTASSFVSWPVLVFAESLETTMQRAFGHAVITVACCEISWLIMKLIWEKYWMKVLFQSVFNTVCGHAWLLFVVTSQIFVEGSVDGCSWTNSAVTIHVDVEHTDFYTHMSIHVHRYTMQSMCSVNEELHTFILLSPSHINISSQ